MFPSFQKPRIHTKNFILTIMNDRGINMDNLNSKELSEKLFYKKKSAFEKYGEDELSAAMEYARDYASFLNFSKT